MRIRLLRVIFAVLLPVVTSGCSAPGTLVAEQQPNEPPRMGVAVVDGSYGLFVAGQTDPIVSCQLKRDDRLGFRFADDGTVGALHIQVPCAIAGDRRFPLDYNTAYEWRLLSTSFTPQPDQIH